MALLGYLDRGALVSLLVTHLINTGLQPGEKACMRKSRFNGFSWHCGVKKPLKRLIRLLGCDTGLKPGVNEMEPKRWR